MNGPIDLYIIQIHLFRFQCAEIKARKNVTVTENAIFFGSNSNSG